MRNMTISRATYQMEELFLFNFQDLLSYFYKATYNYMLQPTPNRQETIFDLFLFLENIFRLILVLFIIIRILNIKHTYYKFYMLLFLVYFVAEISWALGTNNWGTAVRHHVPTIGILLVLSFFNSKQLK